MLEIPQERQQRYEALYSTVKDEMKKKKIADSLFDLCSVWLDRDGNDNQVNLSFLLASSTEAKTELKKSFDKYSEKYGFTMKYVNLTGGL